MKNLDLPESLRREVNEFFLNTQNTQDQQGELDGFLKNVSPSLRHMATKHIFQGIIHQNPIFNILFNHDDETSINFVVKRLEVELATPEHKFVGQDDSDPEHLSHMFFIAKGDCVVFVKDKNKQRIVNNRVRVLYSGEHFGEISLIYSCMRTATVTSNNYCTMAKLSKEKFHEIHLKFPELVPQLKKRIYLYDDSVKLFLEKGLDQISYT